MLAELNAFECVVCGDCHTSYVQFMSKVLIFSVVCGIGPTVTYVYVVYVVYVALSSECFKSRSLMKTITFRFYQQYRAARQQVKAKT